LAYDSHSRLARKPTPPLDDAATAPYRNASSSAADQMTSLASNPASRLPVDPEKFVAALGAGIVALRHCRRTSSSEQRVRAKFGAPCPAAPYWSNNRASGLA
jgi:hypothetical protein